jgi:hypothetical protein
MPGYINIYLKKKGVCLSVIPRVPAWDEKKLDLAVRMQYFFMEGEGWTRIRPERSVGNR